MAGNVINRTNGGFTEEGMLYYLSLLFRYGTAGGWTISQRASGANMSVDASVGGGDFASSGSYPYFGYTKAVENVSVSTANPTNPRKDIVVAFVDMSIENGSNNAGALKFMAVSGTPAASPSDPSDTVIQAAVGAGNPWQKRARITLPAGATTVVNSYITQLGSPMALAVPYLWGGSSNTIGHLVPNVADDTVVLANAPQTLKDKTLVDTSGWTPFTPTWTASGTTPSIGNGTLQGWYKQVGKRVDVRIHLTMGSTTSAGSGVWTFGLPVNASSNMLGSTPIGQGWIDQSGVFGFPVMIVYNGANGLNFFPIRAENSYAYISGGSGGPGGATIPFTFATNNFLRLTGTYEAA